MPSAAPSVQVARAGSPFAGDSLRRLVQRRYELRLVERGLAVRPGASTPVHDESEEEDDGRSPFVERPEAVSGELATEIEEWLARVVLVDGDQRYPVRELGRRFANAWRRAGGERPLPPLLALVSPASTSSVEGTARTNPLTVPPLVGESVRAVPPATDEESKEGSMGLTEREQKIADTMTLPALDVAERFGMTKAAVYTARSTLKRSGKVKASKAVCRLGRLGGGLPAEVEASPAGDDELIAPLRAALEQLDVKRARIVAGIVALGGEA